VPLVVWAHVEIPLGDHGKETRASFTT